MNKQMLKWILTLVVVSTILVLLIPTASYATTSTFRPNATGTNTSLVAVGDTPAYACIDESTADDNTTYVETHSAVQWQLGTYGIPDHTTETGTINSVTVYIRCGKYAGHAFEAVYVNGTAYYGTVSHDIANGDYEDYSYEWTTNPDDDEAWEWADIDALEIGVRLIADTSSYWTRCTQVYAVVDYTPPSAPDITTNAASSVGQTTARLNSTVIDDGGVSCEVRWGYGESSESAIADYDTYTSYSGSYTTGQNPYYDVSSLSSNTTYYFRVEIQNAADTELGGELSFTTSSSVGNPSDFIAYPSSTSVSLVWTKGSGATNSYVRYRNDTFPTSYTDGTEVYTGTSSSYTHEDLTRGTTYYYAVWGESGGNYSASSAEVMVTTSATATGGDELDAPTTPLRWLTGTDYTNLEDLPVVYDAVNAVADSLSMPRATAWFLVFMGFGVLCGLIGYLFSHGSTMVALIAMEIGFAFGWAVQQVPLAIPAILAIIMSAMFFTKRRETV